MQFWVYLVLSNSYFYIRVYAKTEKSIMATQTARKRCLGILHLEASHGLWGYNIPWGDTLFTRE